MNKIIEICRVLRVVFGYVGLKRLKEAAEAAGTTEGAIDVLSKRLLQEEGLRTVVVLVRKEKDVTDLEKVEDVVAAHEILPLKFCH